MLGTMWAIRPFDVRYPHPNALPPTERGHHRPVTTRKEEVRGGDRILTASEVDLDRVAVDTVCVLAMDAIQKAGSGHPGTARALAPAAYALWTRFQEHAPDLLASTRVGEAEEGRAVVSTINRNSGTHQPASTGQASTGPAQALCRGPCQRFARNCATRNLAPPHPATLDSVAHLRNCVGT
jgi:hypothetical protein